MSQSAGPPGWPAHQDQYRQCRPVGREVRRRKIDVGVAGVHPGRRSRDPGLPQNSPGRQLPLRLPALERHTVWFTGVAHAVLLKRRYPGLGGAQQVADGPVEAKVGVDLKR
ncbi:hypothetical protein QFZ57_002515 [Arthrobacter sp. B1I2]|nr:hypothetical protein [Arthrobacter sp. B1I2]MDQ0731721.1 hypothetical protein [Arthrobacter sp. B1I2]